MKRLLGIFCFFFSFLISSVVFGQRTLIHCGKLIVPQSLTVQNEMTILVEGNKIVDLQKGYLKPTGTDKLIDLKSKTVMPV